jgi:hypothetical protein
LEALLSPAVVVEGRASVVIATTVGFDDQPGIAPEEIGFEPAVANIERSIDLGTRQFCSRAHAQEVALQFAARPLCRWIEFIEKHAQSGDPTAAAAAADQLAHRSKIEDPQHLRLGDGLPQLPHWNYARKVKQGPLYARARDSEQRSSINLRHQAIPVRVNALWDSPTSVRRGDVNRSTAVLPQLPQRRRRPMRQHRALPARQHRSHELPRTG